jgi:purine-nucleoside phosphorylase
MYRSLTADAFRQAAGLPEGYHVDGLLATGVWDLFADKQISLVESALTSLGQEVELTRLPGSSLGHGYEFRVAGKVFWWVPVMGTAVMSQYVHCATLLGSQKNLLFGTVGGLRHGMRAGDLVVPSASVGNDNALMYQRDVVNKLFTPDENLRLSLLSRIRDLELPESVQLWQGVTNTCEVMFAESSDDVAQWSEEGFLGVEMEAAMMFALSASFNVPSAAVLSVADNLIEEESFFSENYEDNRKLRMIVKQLQYDVLLAELVD